MNRRDTANLPELAHPVTQADEILLGQKLVKCGAQFALESGEGSLPRKKEIGEVKQFKLRDELSKYNPHAKNDKTAQKQVVYKMNKDNHRQSSTQVHDYGKY